MHCDRDPSHGIGVPRFMSVYGNCTRDLAYDFQVLLGGEKVPGGDILGAERPSSVGLSDFRKSFECELWDPGAEFLSNGEGRLVGALHKSLAADSYQKSSVFLLELATRGAD